MKAADRTGTGKKRTVRMTEKDRQKHMKVRLIMLMMFMLVSFTASAVVVEAGPLDSVRTGWAQISTYVLSMQFWVNALIIFGGLFVLFTLLLKKHMGSDKNTMIIMYIILGVAALMIASKITVGGVPQYLWHNEQFRETTQFLIGPARPLSPCAAPSPPWWRNIWSEYFSNPPCCGVGAYFKPTPDNPAACKQAILRSNNGSGLPAFIIAGILFFLLFNGFGKTLGFDRTGKWFPIILSLILAALLANSRVTKSQVLVIGGWVAVLLIGNKLSKNFGSDKDPKGTKKGFGFGLAYAFVSLILNMLGTSLWGGQVSASQVGFGSILWNLAIGFGVGFIYSFFAGGGILGKILDSRRKKAEKDIDKLVEDGKVKEPFLRALPIIGSKWSPKNPVKKMQGNIDKLTGQLDEVKKLYRLTSDEENRNPELYDQINAKVKKIENKIAEALRKGP